MLRAACHCTAVRFEIEDLPTWVLDCNCTLCRRYGAIWAYPTPESVHFLSDVTDTYEWQEGDHLAFHRCTKCGCVTHMVAVNTEGKQVLYGINVRMIPTLDPASVELRQVDHGYTGWFWSHSEKPPRASHHPAMPPPGPEDWR